MGMAFSGLLAAACMSACLKCVLYLPAQPAAPTEGSAVVAPTADEWKAMAEEVTRDVERLRGWKFKTPVNTDVYTEEKLRAYVEAKVFDELYGEGRLERTEAFLRMVGLIPRDCDLRQTFLDVLLNQIGGFYDPDRKTFFMLSRTGVDYGPLLNRTLIAHELTHALDDQYVDLAELAFNPDLTEDAAIAIGSVLEGSATALMSRYSVEAMQSGRYDAAQLAEVHAREMERSRPLLEAPPYFSALIAQYLCGMAFVFRGDLGGLVDGNEADDVLRALKDPPRSSEQILHPQKYWDPRHRDEPVLVDDDQVRRLVEGDGRSVIFTNTVGELLCAILTTDEARELNLIAAANPAYWTNEAAKGWGGDRFFLLGREERRETGASPDGSGADVSPGQGGSGVSPEPKDDDRPAAGAAADSERPSVLLKDLRGVWITTWDAADDREEFIEDYLLWRELPGRHLIRLAPRAAVFLFGYEDGPERERIERALTSTKLRFKKDGRDWSPYEDE